MTKNEDGNASHPIERTSSDQVAGSEDSEPTAMRDTSGTRGEGGDDPTDGGDEHSRVDEPPTDRESVDRTIRPDESIEDPQPHISVTIEGEYTSVLERIDHPHAFQQNEFDMVLSNLESTLLAVVKTGGGIRSEIYNAANFELDDPWEIRKYLAVLEMHNLIHQKEDQWMPSDYFESGS